MILSGGNKCSAGGLNDGPATFPLSMGESVCRGIAAVFKRREHHSRCNVVGSKVGGIYLAETDSVDYVYISRIVAQGIEIGMYFNP